MNRFSILSNRKRAVIALIHSVFFLGIAIVSFFGQPKAGLLLGHHAKPVGDLVMLAIYLVVTAILVVLVRFSNSLRERLYFAFCSTSATIGLLRLLLGDTHFFVARYVRIGMLACAVLIGYFILRGHESTAVASAEMS